MADSNIIGINGNVLFNTVGLPFYCVASTGSLPIKVVAGNANYSTWQNKDCGNWIKSGIVPLTVDTNNNPLSAYKSTASVSYRANTLCCGTCYMNKSGAVTVDSSEYTAIRVNGTLKVAANDTRCVSAYTYWVCGGTRIAGKLTDTVTANIYTFDTSIPIDATFSGYTGPLTVEVRAYAYGGSTSDYSGTFNFDYGTAATLGVSISAKA